MWISLSFDLGLAIPGVAQILSRAGLLVFLPETITCHKNVDVWNREKGHNSKRFIKDHAMIFDELKKMLLEDKDTEEIFKCFFGLSHIWGSAKRCQFINKPAKNKVLMRLLHSILLTIQTLQEETISKIRFLEIPSENFYHGKFSISSTSIPCAMFYFSDINIGIVTYFDIHSGTQKIFQFLTTDLTDSNPILN